MKVKELLISEDVWTTQHLARNINGESTYSQDIDAVCWCLLGAIGNCYMLNEHKRKQVINKVESHLKMGIAEWNDKPERTFDDVRNLVLELNI